MHFQNPMSKPELDVEETPTEILYQETVKIKIKSNLLDNLTNLFQFYLNQILNV